MTEEEFKQSKYRVGEAERLLGEIAVRDRRIDELAVLRQKLVTDREEFQILIFSRDGYRRKVCAIRQ
jgi:hypothetical protein